MYYLSYHLSGHAVPIDLIIIAVLKGEIKLNPNIGIQLDFTFSEVPGLIECPLLKGVIGAQFMILRYELKHQGNSRHGSDGGSQVGKDHHQ